MSASVQTGESHTGPTESSRQSLLATAYAVLLPLFILCALAYYAISTHTRANSDSQQLAATDARISKVGGIEIRDANRPLVGGQVVYEAQCAACHASGVAGAPTFGDASAWTARIDTGFDALVKSALEGKGAMAPQGGGNFSDLEIARAVAYMTHAAGASFAEPDPESGEGESSTPAP
ncbi:cytochrome c5 family protein [Corticibacter populi]|uniref:Cytochrome c5 family protein n=1 Tax=Corticibacter populi TaxID=1550736 RepID=A0A3M6QIW1_9BURK|nr:c-type cytochrome [Corticibacter populi]RMX03020.1 cytochrome c5 family protein [Corticibacter populi]RZS33453.1 cytochrome c5 [Corticibacter populi]